MTCCVVIGAGIIGMLTARELMLSGWRVTMLERGRAGSESSWAGGGILSPLYPWRYPDPVNALARWSQQHYAELCRLLEESSGVDPQWTPSGLLIADVEAPPAAIQWAGRFGARLEFVDAARARQLEPRLGLEAATAAWLPDVAQVRNPRFARALRVTLQKAGVDIRTDCAAVEWKREGDRIAAVRTAAGEEVTADRFVVASGAWTAGLLEPTGLSLPIEPVRGQMIVFRGPPGLVSRISLYKGHYVIPRRDGRVLVGSTLEYVGFDKQTTGEALDELKRAALELIPNLGTLPIEHHWAGLRPGSPRGVPIIGPHPEIANLYICAGHFRNGVVLGPASARLLSNQLLEGRPILDPTPYLPEKILKNS
ncbi:MAG: glycine oxidase ThiO [Gammaproteobacteria bacterium]|jgi:glycine oxidase